MCSFKHSVETEKEVRLSETYAGHPEAQTESNWKKDLMQANKTIFKLLVNDLKLVTKNFKVLLFWALEETHEKYI